MLALAKIVIIFIFPFWIGLVIVNAIERGKRHFAGPEKLGLSLSIGMVMISFFLLYLGVLKISITVWSVFLVFVFLIPINFISIREKGVRAYFSFYRFQKCIFQPGHLWRNVLLILILVLIIAKFIYILYYGLTVPPYFDDPVSRWNYKAKVFFIQKSLVLESSHQDFLGGTALRYPLGNSLFKTWTALVTGGWGERYVNLSGAAIYLAIIIVGYYRFRVSLNIFASLIFSYFLASIPLLVFHSGTGHTDGILGYYFSFSIIYLYDGLRKKYPDYIIIASILMAAALFTKAEAISYFISGALPLLFCYFLFGKNTPLRVKAIYVGLYLLPLAVLIFPWIYLKNAYGIVQTLPARRYGLEFHPQGIPIIIRDLFNSGNFNFAWMGMVIVILLGIKRIIKTDLFWLFLSCLGLAINLIFFHIFTSLYEFLEIGTQFNRLVLHILPLFIFLSSRIMGFWLPRDDTS